MHTRKWYLTLTNLQECEQNKFLVAFTVHTVSDSRWVREDQFELIYGLLVSFQPGVYQTLVIEIADYVHRQGMLFEACGRVFNYLECMLIALGFDAKLGELTV